MTDIFCVRLPEGAGRERQKTEHEAGLSLLRYGLRERFGLQFSLRELKEKVAADEFGKPFLPDLPEAHFNISHCGNAAVCAMSGGTVGVDIECVRPVRPSLVRRTLHEDEKRGLAAYGTLFSERENVSGQAAEETGIREANGASKANSGLITDPCVLELFFRFWTLKESYLKKKGTGIREELSGTCFTVDPGRYDLPISGGDEETVSFQKKLTFDGETDILSVSLEKAEAGVWEENSLPGFVLLTEESLKRRVPC